MRFRSRNVACVHSAERDKTFFVATGKTTSITQLEDLLFHAASVKKGQQSFENLPNHIVQLCCSVEEDVFNSYQPSF